MRWIVSGPLTNGLNKFAKEEKSNIIILGDACFYNPSRSKLLKQAKSSKHTFYCVRGGHEPDPEYWHGLIELFDKDIDGVVFYNPDIPNIKYFEDGQIYKIGKKTALVIGGGSALDEKELLLKGKECFENTMLNQAEMDEITKFVSNRTVDYVFTYTGPMTWEKPTNGHYEMEIWMSQIKDLFTWKNWMFGRYLQDIDLADNIKEVHEDIFEL